MPMNAKEMVEQFCVSERTARRHIAKDTTPDPRRSLGRDGKTLSRVAGQLPPRHAARAGVWVAPPRSGDGTQHYPATGATSFTYADLPEMRTIATEAGELLRRWTIAVEAEEHRRRVA
jgi:hypothetical protein